jgi:hypothetical protein
MGALVNSNLVAQLADKWGCILRRKRHRSLGGVYDRIIQGLEFHHLVDVLGGPLGGFPGSLWFFLKCLRRLGGMSQPLLTMRHSSNEEIVLQLFSES